MTQVDGVGSTRDRNRILKILTDGPLSQTNMLKKSRRRRQWKWALMDLEYEGKIWLNWSWEYELK